MQSFLKLKAADSRLCSQACKTAMLSGVFLMLSEQTNSFSSTTGGVKLTLAHSLTQLDVFSSVLDQQCRTRGLWPRTGHQLKEPLLWNWFSSFLIIFSNPDSGFYLFKWPASATPLKLISLFTLHYLPLPENSLVLLFFSASDLFQVPVLLFLL